MKHIQLSSLPQGWHNIPGPSLTGPAKMSNSSVPTTIRKKWNSSLSTEVPKSKLPSYKTSNLRMQNPSSGGKLMQNGTSTASRLSYPAPSNKLPPSPAKPSVNKEYQAEIAKLRKELTTIKAENLILKAKVRRVDDESDFKSRQIEKLRAELKSLQKVEAASNKKNKDSELLLLRRKCLQLEGSLKEKDLALKKLQYEMSKKDDQSKTSAKDLCTEIYSKKVAETGSSKPQKPIARESSSSATLTRVSQSLKLEVMKLRDMIHKLEKENQDLQQQVKENGQENRRLKMQLKKENQVSSQQIPKPKGTSNITKSNLENHVPNHLVKPKVVQKSNVPNQKSTTNLKASTNAALREIRVPRTLPLKISPQDNSNVAKNKYNKTTSISQTRKIVLQKKQKNIAAKKIQQGWREHQKRCLRRPDKQNEDRALTFIVSCLKHHALRKDKLNCLTKKGNSSKLTDESDSVFAQAIQSAKMRIWNKDD
ncbi:leucine zipper protein 1-like [Uloborus diversus]|uniref:leucine zipper protein 1-like n=1 Tax=Uloborus diversus TaxID=327109 RepID=UPI00240911F4|nr:leucine zipper protein 1-like [Uloborus diversus]